MPVDICVWQHAAVASFRCGSHLVRLQHVEQVGTMTLANRRQIFGERWIRCAHASGGRTSWVSDVLATPDTTGGVYLRTIRTWFHQFPLTLKQKQQLRSRLESFKNDEHLGGVNELAWWAFMRREGLTAKPLPASSTPRPDFYLEPPAGCFVEVSTLNMSDIDKAKFQRKASVALDHAETIRRIVGKLTAEKQRQLTYAANLEKPCVLVLFDYTTWSAFATEIFRTLGEFLLGRQYGFRTLPPELSAIVYVERKVLPNGCIAINRHWSAAYYNPLTLHPLPLCTFPFLTQFRCQLISNEPKMTDPWAVL